MGILACIVSGGNSLFSFLDKFLDADDLVVLKKPSDGASPFSPRLLLIECDYRCRVERCSANFRHALGYPTAGVCLIRPVLTAAQNCLQSAFLIAHLREGEFPLESEWTENLARNLIAEAVISRGSSHALPVFELERTIVESNGMVRSLADFSHTASRSVSWISHNFPVITGISPMKFAGTISLCHSLFQLASTDTAVKCVAYEHGYSQSYFTAVFSSKFGKNPGLVRTLACVKPTEIAGKRN